MVWRTYITDAHDGTIITPIDLPSFTWSMTVNDSSLSTTPSKEVGVDDVSGITVPWNAVPGDTQRENTRPSKAAGKPSPCSGAMTTTCVTPLSAPQYCGV